MKLTYQHTMYACFMGSMVQAVVNNFVPLLFLTFERSFGIHMGKITFLVTFNFVFQLLVDFLAPGVVDKIGQRAAMAAANFFSAVGLVGLTVLPGLFADPFSGLFLSVVIYALVGKVSSRMGENLKAGILTAVIFPLLLMAGVWLCRIHTAEKV